MLQSDWRELRIEARAREVDEGDRTLDFAVLAAMGHAYWDDWKCRTKSRERTRAASSA